jgi:hypothetical protein
MKNTHIFSNKEISDTKSKKNKLFRSTKSTFHHKENIF